MINNSIAYHIYHDKYDKCLSYLSVKQYVSLINSETALMPCQRAVRNFLFNYAVCAIVELGPKMGQVGAKCCVKF